MRGYQRRLAGGFLCSATANGRFVAVDYFNDHHVA
jgi:hypothetical protein